MLRVLQITAAVLLEAFALFMTMLVCIVIGSFMFITSLTTVTICIEMIKSGFIIIISSSIPSDQWKEIIETYY